MRVWRVEIESHDGDAPARPTVENEQRMNTNGEDGTVQGKDDVVTSNGRPQRCVSSAH